MQYTLVAKLMGGDGCIYGYRLRSGTLTHDIGLQDASKFVSSITDAYMCNGYIRLRNKRMSTVKTVTKKEIEKEGITGYLKWLNKTVGVIKNHTTLIAVNKDLNPVVSMLFKGRQRLPESEYIAFLTDRVISRDRRDIEKILRRLGLVKYDVVKIAELTCALNPKDMFWIAQSDDAKLHDTIHGVFTDIFKHEITFNGSSVFSPDGANIKEYAISNNSYGIAKRRLSKLSTDAESEVAVYLLGNLLGVSVCPAWFVDTDTIFSQFIYSFEKEYLVHARRFFVDGELTDDFYADLCKKFTGFEKQLAKMILIDFITRQDDRHLSNFAFVFKSGKKMFYPLYDNGRSLFYDEPEDFSLEAYKDICLNSTTFGQVGTYYDTVCKIASTFKIGSLINLSITELEVLNILKTSRFMGYRLEASLRWIITSVNFLKSLDNKYN